MRREKGNVILCGSGLKNMFVLFVSMCLLNGHYYVYVCEMKIGSGAISFYACCLGFHRMTLLSVTK